MSKKMRSSLVYCMWAACSFISVFTQYNANIIPEWQLHIDTSIHEQWLHLYVLLAHAHIVWLQELTFAAPVYEARFSKRGWNLTKFFCENPKKILIAILGGYSINEVRWSMHILYHTFVVVVFHRQAYSDVHPLSVYGKVRSSTKGLELSYFSYLAHFLFLVSRITAQVILLIHVMMDNII